MIDYGIARNSLSAAVESHAAGKKVRETLDLLLTGVLYLIPDEAPVVPVPEDPWNFHSEQGISIQPVNPWPFVVPVELIPDRVARAEKRMAELEEALKIAEAANIDGGKRIDLLTHKVELWTNDYYDLKAAYETLATEKADLANKLGEALLPNELVRGPDGRYWEVLARGEGFPGLVIDVVVLRCGGLLDSVSASTFDINYTPIYKTVAEAA